ncbi:MAG: RDD family protein [Pirellulaceae bacterium]|nr:RDD family protein [Pirellulaceae bacterium]
MSNAFNPYSAPASSDPFRAPRRTADLGKRFLGALVDGLVGLIVLPGYIAVIIGAQAAERSGNVSIPLLLGMGWMGVTIIAVLVVQIYLLATRSQTIGKYVMKTQIVDFATGQPADFVHCFVLRALVNGLIGAVPCVGSIYAIVDICFIFREDRRCIHDLLASTVVVDIS